MRDDTARLLANRAQFDNSAQTREAIRERTPAVRGIEHTIVSALDKMQQHQIRRMPVIGKDKKDKKLVGLISEADTARRHKMSGGLSHRRIAEFMDSVYASR